MKGKKGLRIAGIVLAALLLLLLGCRVNHSIQLDKERALLTAPGQLVDVNGHSMHVYTQGEGEKTLVFLSGAGTCSPTLDFRSLYSLLTDEYRIAVVEKAGYGFSDDSDASRDIATMLSETRQALMLAGVQAPYVLCPHSMSGLEALYWAQEYPDEVEAIVGLDMATPKSYTVLKFDPMAFWFAKLALDAGIVRLLPAFAESDAIRYGTLTAEEQAQYRALFYHSTASNAMLNEAEQVRQNAALVGENGKIAAPCLLFASNGEGTGIEQETWRDLQTAFAQENGGEVVALDCPHYVQDHKYAAIAERIKAFLKTE